MNLFAWWNTTLSATTLSEEDEAQLRREEASTNRWRILRILPIMFVVHLVHVYMLSGTTALDPLYGTADLFAWRRGLWTIHLTTAMLDVLIVAWVWANKHNRHHAALVVLTYQLHAAAVAGVDQLNHGTVAPYMAYSLVNVVLLLLNPKEVVALFTVSSIAFVTAVMWGEQDPVQRFAVLPAGPSIMVPAVMLTWFLHNNRRKDFYFRETIARQRQALADLNGDLQERVEQQTASLRRRADEVETLNQKLQLQVRDRSIALARALSQLEDLPPVTTLDGTVLASHYAVGRRIGAGGMGVVHEGIDLRDQSRVAIKLLRASTMGRDQLSRFLREVQTASSLTHPAIVRMLHVDVTDEGVPFQIQELVEGESLHRTLQRVTRLESAHVLSLIRWLAEAIQYAHEHGVIHRDIKPSNVMLTSVHPGLKLLDFGIAKDGDSESLTATGGILGTPSYMAPELWREGSRASTASDVFSLAMTVYRMTFGSVPLPGATVDPDGFSMLPDPIARLLRDALHPDPAERPPVSEITEMARRHVTSERFVSPECSDAFVIDEEEGGTHLTFG